MRMNEPAEVLEEQLKKMFMITGYPPNLWEWKLQQLAREREQKRLLMAASLISFLWTMLSFVFAILIMGKNQLLGESMIIVLFIGLFSAGLLSAALLHTEQFSK